MDNESKLPLTAAQLMVRGETLRIEEPVLWAITRSRGRLDKIGILSGQGPKSTRDALTDLMEHHDIILSSEHENVYLLNTRGPRYRILDQLRRFYELIELKWLDELDVRPDKGQVSSNVERLWREKHPDRASRIERFDETLTLKQAQFLALASTMGPTFRPLDIARAQGYTQQGYTKSSLISLSQKGYVQEVNERPSTWSLTQAGVEAVKAIRAKGIKPRIKERMSEEAVADL